MAHEYKATIAWKRGAGEAFTDLKFSRAHQWSFDGGITVPGSSSPLSVRVPYSRAEAVDPEEALVAALSSCHMLTFLYLAAKQGLIVESYQDDAVGVMTKNARGKLFVSKVALRPRIAFAGAQQPNAAQLAELHHHAHEECYIANSVVTEVVVEPAPVSHQ
jgi:organic hydroperoxide reductase OsmC/OhrA